MRKRLYPQAVATLRKALKNIDEEPDEAQAIIENALGFGLAAQDKFESAIVHYKSALKAKADYPVALNNLAFAQEQLNKIDEAYELYQKVILIDPKNKTALKQIKKIQEKKKNSLPNGSDGKGF